MSLKSINPATGKLLKSYEEYSGGEVKKIIEKSNETFLNWRNTGFKERAELMKKAAQILRENKEEYSVLMADEMGKPVKEGRKESEKCAWVCEYYAENAENFLRLESIETDASKSYITFKPLGVILAIMPWNFPFWQVFRFAAPAIMAGNAGILKHSSNVQGCALAIEDIFRKAGFPVNIFKTLVVSSKQVDSIIGNDLIKAVTLTGSTPAGSSVAKKSGELIKKTVLELGGSDPYVILEDADLESAAVTCVTSRLINSGQSCIAAKRFIVVDSIRAKFEELFVEGMKSKKMGNPHDEDTDVGPQARNDLRDELHQQVTGSVKKGAKCLLGGEIPEREGAFYPPTVLTDVKKGMPAFDEELFGPVAAIVPVSDEKEAIDYANDSVFGLGAAVFTKDLKKGEKIAADDINAGCCFVNSLVKSDPRLPFGGVKTSGYGRELSYYGIKEFVNIKTVFVK